MLAPVQQVGESTELTGPNLLIATRAESDEELTSLLRMCVQALSHCDVCQHRRASLRPQAIDCQVGTALPTSKSAHKLYCTNQRMRCQLSSCMSDLSFASPLCELEPRIPRFCTGRFLLRCSTYCRNRLEMAEEHPGNPKSNIGASSSPLVAEVVGGTGSIEVHRSRAPVHTKTFVAVFAIGLIYFTQLITLVGAGAVSFHDVCSCSHLLKSWQQGQTIAARFNGTASVVWLSAPIAILTVILGPITSQAADYWGRKWLLVIVSKFKSHFLPFLPYLRVAILSVSDF